MSNAAGEKASININASSEKSGRMIREDEIVVNTADIQWLNRYGTTLINGKPAGTSFGADFVTATEKAEIAVKWEEGIAFKLLEIDLNDGAKLQITADESTIELVCGTDAASFGYVYSKSRIRYEAGVPGFEKFTLAFDNDNHNGDYEHAFGLLCPQCGYAIAKVVESGVSSLKFLLRNKGIDTFYDLNGDAFPENQDPSNLNIYRIDYGYLGVDTTRLFVRDVDNSKWVKLHEQKYAQRFTSINTPNLPIGAFVRNKGNTAVIGMLNGSIQAGNIDGRIGTDPSARQNSYKFSGSVVGATDGLIFAFRNDTTTEMYDSIDSNDVTTTRIFNNAITSLLKKVKATTDGAQNVDISLYITTIDKIQSGLFTPVELGFSILDISEDAVIDLIGAELVDDFPLTKVDSFNELLIAENNQLLPGQVAVFTYTTQAGSDITVFISFEDQF